MLDPLLDVRGVHLPDPAAVWSLPKHAKGKHSIARSFASDDGNIWFQRTARRQLRQLGCDLGAGHVPGHLEDEPLIAQINDRSKTLRIVSPQVKALACGDVGVGAMAEVDLIADAVGEMARSQP